jgi:hypothetical protein
VEEEAVLRRQNSFCELNPLLPSLLFLFLFFRVLHSCGLPAPDSLASS